MGFAGGFSLLFSATSILIWTSPKFAMANVRVTDFFEDQLHQDLTKVTWAHAVNSQDKLSEALNSDVMMLEADILMGTKEGSDKKVPIMAHPPSITSDLLFEDFLKKVIKANENNKKGIKLDFKDIGAVAPVMKLIEKNRRRKALTFPIWVNADIWVGPVNATTQPLDPEAFIDALTSKDVRIQPTLSIGWTTRFGTEKDQTISKGQYTHANQLEALKFLDTAGIDANIREVTFPVRAGIAAQSADVLLDLLNRAGNKATLTLWSKEDDPVDMDQLEHMITLIGREKIYADLPFSLPGSSNTSPIPTHRGKDKKDVTTTTTTRPTTSITTTTTTAKSTDSRKIKDDKNIKDHLVIVEDKLDPNSTVPHVNSGEATASLWVVVVASLLFIFCTY